jgi:uroporphyrinogen decarboxylase
VTSRERVRKALNFEAPDRVPIDLGAMRASGIAASLYTRMKQRRGLTTPTKVCDAMQILAEVEPAMLDALNIDVVPLDVTGAAWQLADARAGVSKRLFDGTEVIFPPGTRIAVEPTGDWVLQDQAGHSYARMPKSGYYFDFIRPTMAGHIVPEKFQPSTTVRDEDLDAVARLARHLHENTDKAILGWGPAVALVGLSALLADNLTQGSLDAWLVMLMTEKETAHEMMGRYVDSVIQRLTLYQEAVGDRAIAWGVASDDAGTQRSELLHPDLFAEMIKPHYRRLCEWVHTHTPWKTFLHSCGSIHGYIEHWIDAGIDILNPVQISAANMEPARLQEEFGGRIVFWGGGCDTQHVLPLGSSGQVREHVRENLAAFRACEGGFIFTQVHNLQPNVPVENVEAMFAAAHEFGSA